jgi:hypothetical protein
VDWLRRLEQIKLAAISVFIFGAWLVASEGWVRAASVVWLVYPTYVGWRVISARRRTGS